MCKGRTGAGQSESQTGRETSTTGAQWLQLVANTEPELASVVKAWCNLPGQARSAIVALVEVFRYRTP